MDARSVEDSSELLENDLNRPASRSDWKRGCSKNRRSEERARATSVAAVVPSWRGRSEVGEMNTVARAGLTRSWFEHSTTDSEPFRAR